jgi:hypothetical protein
MQLELFHKIPKSPSAQKIWESLSKEERAAVVTVFARLMKKTIQAEQRRNNNE